MNDLAIVWDMGGVLNRYFTQVVVEIGTARGWPIHDVPLGPSGHVPDPDYQAMCDGELEEADYLVRFKQRLSDIGIDYDPRAELDWRELWRPETFGLIRDAHAAGRAQAIVTNDAAKWMGDGWWERWEHAGEFDVIIDVSTLSHRKPHAEPYLTAAEALGRPPESCIFVDDMMVNCRGAEAVGMQSHLFDVQRPAESIEALRERVGLS